ncbi:MAG: Unknown protein [uncultured Thiotrichaceae bacterium]|uniref:DsrS n=1 Tax=uncultured Thiotrichaceae bacterium TaxID=298394 RepID=A0A6S6TVE3_9GAMM|nr:MAG: Unknown protein [uncultured Thiotrichaceae bacterium]
MMQLSNEDNLRMNVLLAQQLKAIRINEGTMTVHALTDKGEAKVKLNPTSRDEQYLRWIREMISMKVTGSPGGYPIFLKRWTRMGHADNTLEHMLLLGEPEAIVALVHAPTLSHDIGKYAWWANPTTEVARRLLHYPEVVEGELGRELAEYLLEFLPFEERQLNVVDTVRLCLQGELISDDQRAALWARAKRKNPYYVGFLHSEGLIPAENKENYHCDEIKSRSDLSNNVIVDEFVELFQKPGQQWLGTLKNSLKKPVDQDVVISLFKAVDSHFTLEWPEHRGVRDINQACERAELWMQNQSECSEQLHELNRVLDDKLRDKLQSFLVLSQIGEDTLIPIFAGNDSVGSVMRRRLEPVTKIIVHHVDNLLA